MAWEAPLAQAARIGKRNFIGTLRRAAFPCLARPTGQRQTSAEPDVKDAALVWSDNNQTVGPGMNAVFDRLSLYQNSRRPARRKVARNRVKAEAVLVSSADERRTIAICDVSHHGCSIRGEGMALRAGRFVAIELDADAPVQALVRWVRDDDAGLEFLRPIPADRTAWQALINPAWEG